MPALARIGKPAEEVEQAAREAAALNDYESAKQRGDREAATAAWKRYSEIHAQRPQSMVERMEIEQGLR